jgi:hypothetical protein
VVPQLARSALHCHRLFHQAGSCAGEARAGNFALFPFALPLGWGDPFTSLPRNIVGLTDLDAKAFASGHDRVCRSDTSKDKQHKYRQVGIRLRTRDVVGPFVTKVCRLTHLRRPYASLVLPIS